MKTIVALLSTVIVLATGIPAGAMPVDNYRSIPSNSPTTTAPSPSSGAETWVVIAVAALAFGAGRLAPAVRLRSAS